MGNISLDRLSGGALLEMFNKEMKKVAGNISDPHTSAGGKRTVSIKIEITPDEDRRIGDMSASVSSSLCPAKSIKGRFVFGFNFEKNEGEASELNTEMLGQIGLGGPDTEESPESSQPGVIDLRKIKESV